MALGSRFIITFADRFGLTKPNQILKTEDMAFRPPDVAKT